MKIEVKCIETLWSEVRGCGGLEQGQTKLRGILVNPGLLGKWQKNWWMFVHIYLQVNYCMNLF